ncbi:hypothetical protein ASF48_04940 [Rathayibacter sp. Leaf299]|uniref:hypothetical protein n=1 Tax=Rathayibacter sp. Leaf299 TaxID=1736328 RepID=UPI0006FC86FD|nr:hypothetical protein [Rathayibacter sp. Leaf299]KQQ22532.1 hypothetical protein ASF48_04940 [Rathayibacter sp. Leaf299]
MIDVDALMFQLLDGAIEGLTILDEVDAASADPFALPYGVYSVDGDGQQSNGPAYSLVLDVQIFASTKTEARGFAHRLYDHVHTWEIPGLGVIEDLAAGVDIVTDIRLPSRVAAPLIPDNDLAQYSSSFGLLVSSL